MKLFIVLSLLSINAFAGTWFDMEANKEYTVLQSFSLPQEERSGSSLEVTKGDKFVLKEIIGLGMGLGLFNFQYAKCPGPDMVTDIEIIPIDNSAPLVEIGAKAELNCEMWIYVELKDFWTNSLFE